MKQKLSIWLLSLLAVLMVFGLTACDGQTEELTLIEPDQPAYTETEEWGSAEGDVTEAAENEDPAEADAPEEPDAGQTAAQEEETLDEDGSYTSKEDVALYIHLYGHLPDNFITKKTARTAGWSGGSLEPYFPGCSIGGDRFGNYEGTLPDKNGRTWFECDIDTMGARKRGAKRIIFSNDGLIYYTGDHYETFELLYGEE